MVSLADLGRLTPFLAVGLPRWITKETTVAEFIVLVIDGEVDNPGNKDYESNDSSNK